MNGIERLAFQLKIKVSWWLDPAFALLILVARLRLISRKRAHRVGEWLCRRSYTVKP